MSNKEIIKIHKEIESFLTFVLALIAIALAFVFSVVMAILLTAML